MLSRTSNMPVLRTRTIFIYPYLRNEKKIIEIIKVVKTFKEKINIITKKIV